MPVSLDTRELFWSDRTVALTDDPAVANAGQPRKEHNMKAQGKSLFDGLANAKGRSPVQWKVQECFPRDQFETCTLTIEQWLANSDDDGYGLTNKAAKWQALMLACALALPGVTSQDGLRQEPRVGYDPLGDQLFFIFKASNNGTTYLVSPEGIDMRDEEITP
jgi:hypothetical protein